MLSRLVYRSQAAQDFEPDDLSALVALSADNNARDGVSGLLVFSGGHFLQVVEGPAEAISRLRNKLERDPRHTGFVELINGPAAHRLFDGWSLACNVPGLGAGLSLQVARHLARLEWNDADLAVIALLGQFWSDFSGCVDLNQGRRPVWSPSVLRA